MAQRAALDDREAAYALAMLDAGALGSDLAAYLGVSAMAISRLRHGFTHAGVVPLSAAEVRAFAADRDGKSLEDGAEPKPDGWPDAWVWPIPRQYACGDPVPASCRTPERVAWLLAQLDRQFSREQTNGPTPAYPSRPLPRDRETIAATHYSSFGDSMHEFECRKGCGL